MKNASEYLLSQVLSLSWRSPKENNPIHMHTDRETAYQKPIFRIHEWWGHADLSKSLNQFSFFTITTPSHTHTHTHTHIYTYICVWGSTKPELENLHHAHFVKNFYMQINIIISRNRNYDRLCGLVVRVPGWYQISWEVVGLERGPLSLVSITEDLLEWKSTGSGSRKSRLTAIGILCADHPTPSIRKIWH
jgi:hypothetical protein